MEAALKDGLANTPTRQHPRRRRLLTQNEIRALVYDMLEPRGVGRNVASIDEWLGLSVMNERPSRTTGIGGPAGLTAWQKSMLSKRHRDVSLQGYLLEPGQNMVTEPGQPWRVDQCWESGRAGLPYDGGAGWLGVYKLRGADVDGVMVIAEQGVDPKVVRQAAINIAQSDCDFAGLTLLEVPDMDFLRLERYPAPRTYEHVTVQFQPWETEVVHGATRSTIRLTPEVTSPGISPFDQDPESESEILDCTRSELTLTFEHSFAVACVARGDSDWPDGTIMQATWVHMESGIAQN